MNKFVAGLILGLLIAPLAVYCYFATGMAPVAQSDPPMPFEKRLAKMALQPHYLEAAKLRPPIAADEAAFVAGAKIYKENCAVCHGLPNQPASSIARGLSPDPPQLFVPEKMVTDDPAGETYWKAANGLRLTGMPGFHGTLNDTQLWQVALLLAHADKLPPAAQDALK
jgi:mono/diheme cytochrome c family protein